MPDPPSPSFPDKIINKISMENSLCFSHETPPGFSPESNPALPLMEAIPAIDRNQNSLVSSSHSQNGTLFNL
jgi:hypothetical protein